MISEAKEEAERAKGHAAQHVLALSNPICLSPLHRAEYIGLLYAQSSAHHLHFSLQKKAL